MLLHRLLLLALLLPALATAQHAIHLHAVRGEAPYEYIHPYPSKFYDDYYTFLDSADSQYVLLRPSSAADGAFFPATFELGRYVPDGTYQIWVDGKLKQEGRQLHGRYTGTTWSAYSKSTHSWVDGEESGPETGYDDRGRVAFITWHDAGRSPLTIRYYPNGKVRELYFHLHAGMREFRAQFSKKGKLTDVWLPAAPATAGGRTFSPRPGKPLPDGPVDWDAPDWHIRLVFARNEIAAWESFEGSPEHRRLVAAWRRP